MRLTALLENSTFRKLLLDVQQKLIERLPDEFEVELKHGAGANTSYANDRDTVAVTGPSKTTRQGEAIHVFIATKEEFFSNPERETEEGRFAYAYWPRGERRNEVVETFPFDRQDQMIDDLVTLIANPF